MLAAIKARAMENAKKGDRRMRKSGENNFDSRGLRNAKIARKTTAFQVNKYPFRPLKSLSASMVSHDGVGPVVTCR